ncbi:MAG: ABC transporter permease, partial [Gemmatimonadaceae bacterium]
MFLTDLRAALRGLGRRPAFFAGASLTIALGVGATAAIYSFVDAFALQPLPLDRSEELVTIDVRGVEGNLISLSIPNYRDWRDKNRSFASFAAAAGWTLVETDRAPAEALDARAVIGPLFETLRLDMFLGRAFSGAETEPGSEGLVVLGHGYWRRRFASDPSVIGKAITLDGRPYTVTGVLAEHVGWPSRATEVYVNMGSLPGLPFDDRRSSFGTRAFARLAPGTALAMAQEDMGRVWREVQQAEGRPVSEPIVRDLHEYVTGAARQPLFAVLAAVGLLLLIAVVNVANLQLSRGEELQRDIAVRTALGASRGRLMLMRFAESVVIAGIGGTLGLLFAVGLTRLLLSMVPSDAPVLLTERVGLNLTVVLLAVGVTMVAACAIGIVPALRAARTQPGEALVANSRSVTGRSPMSNLLVGVEFALAVMLMVTSGLAMRSLLNLRTTDLGFSPESVMSARLRLPAGQYGGQRWIQLQERVVAEARQLPGTTNAAMTLLMPLSDRSWELTTTAEGRTGENEGEHTLFNMVTPEYFSTLGVPILRGRGFTAADRTNAPPVVVIDEVMAATLWPGQDALGKRLTIQELIPGSTDSTAILYREVVGITKNVRHYAVAEASRPQAYIPVQQAYRRSSGGLYVAVRTRGDAALMARSLREAVGRIDPGIALSDVRTVESYVEDNLGVANIVGWLLSAFGMIAMLLSAVGIFAVTAYSVARRTREFGVRVALGGSPRALIGSGIGRGVALAGAGTVAGLFGAWMLSRLLEQTLYGVPRFDLLTYAGLSGILLVVSAIASWVPSR